MGKLIQNLCLLLLIAIPQTSFAGLVGLGDSSFIESRKIIKRNYKLFTRISKENDIGRLMAEGKIGINKV
jgi:hypothetical protein